MVGRTAHAGKTSSDAPCAWTYTVSLSGEAGSGAGKWLRFLLLHPSLACVREDALLVWRNPTRDLPLCLGLWHTANSAHGALPTALMPCLSLPGTAGNPSRRAKEYPLRVHLIVEGTCVFSLSKL